MDEPQEYIPAVSFGPVGIAVRDDGTLLLVRDNTSEEPLAALWAAMDQAMNQAKQWGYVLDADPAEDTFLFTSWILRKAA